jgi:hypothetical protein
VAWAYRERPGAVDGPDGCGVLFEDDFFGGYVAIMLRIALFRPFPFVASFIGYFVGLYSMEALFLKRLFSERSR